ncbi:hypothetical protein TUN199_07074 [Pyrenophora tritici-repentis]|nr:hypothetical protein TUN199_07074 [Pyrenophora tritici-repentis]
MLRLRPSELTLTPDDVEETFRRIALRQATRPQSTLPRRPLGQPGRPILRRGPQRATRDALTALGKIPFLQPQQALVTSVDEDGENTSACEDISSSIDPDSSNSHHADPTTPHQERQDGPVPVPASSASHTVQLPMRARPESAAQSPVNDTPSNVPRTPQRQILTSPTSGSNDTSGDYALSAADSTPGLRGVFSDAKLNSRTQGKPSGDPSKSPGDPRGIRHLQGYVRSTPTGDVYDFHASWESEPRRRSAREVPAIRSRSAGHLENTYSMQPPSINPYLNSFWPGDYMAFFESDPSRTSGPASHSPFGNVFNTQPPQPTMAPGPNPFGPEAYMGSFELDPSRTSGPTTHSPFENVFSTQPPQPSDSRSPNTQQASL